MMTILSVKVGDTPHSATYECCVHNNIIHAGLLVVQYVLGACSKAFRHAFALPCAADFDLLSCPGVRALF